jgi:hypothetical protein
LAVSKTQCVCWNQRVSRFFRALKHLCVLGGGGWIGIPVQIWKTGSNIGRSSGNIAENWREITLTNSRLLISAALCPETYLPTLCLGWLFNPGNFGQNTYKETHLRDITPCRPLKGIRRFGGSAYDLVHADFLLHIFFDPENGGRTILWNVGWQTARHYIPEFGTTATAVRISNPKYTYIRKLASVSPHTVSETVWPTEEPRFDSTLRQIRWHTDVKAD